MMRWRIILVTVFLLFLAMALLWVRRDVARKAYHLNQLNHRCRQVQKACYGCELDIARLIIPCRLAARYLNLHLGLAPPGAGSAPDLRLAISDLQQPPDLE